MILGPNGKPIEAVAKPRKQVQARFDAAQTSTENAKHWSWADALSADSAANPGVRKTLRERSRYEVANNSYARGIVNFIANDTVGANIRIRMLTEATNKNKRSIYSRKRLMTSDEARFIEGEFYEWLEEICATDKVRTMRGARAVDGEVFAMTGTNKVLESPVKLDFSPFETEMCQSSYAWVPDKNHVDGITYDNWGNPIRYRVLDSHPGSTGGFGMSFDSAKEYGRESILHLFKAERPGQRRGIPQLTASLPLFAQLRRFTLSVVAAAETAADFAAILHTNTAYEEGVTQATPFDIVDIERRMMQVLPEGWDMRQFKAEQPVSTYSEFVRTLLREINRCLDVPMNVALGDSSGYNYASGKLDWQIWQKARNVDRRSLVDQVLDRLFKMWKREAILIEGYLPQSLRSMDVDWSHGWLFDGDKHQDPAKEAGAQEKRLKNHTTTLADEYGAEGKDWEEQLEQIARERAKKLELGLKDEEIRLDEASESTDDEDEDDDELIVARDDSGRITSFRGFR